MSKRPGKVAIWKVNDAELVKGEGKGKRGATNQNSRRQRHRKRPELKEDRHNDGNDRGVRDETRQDETRQGETRRDKKKRTRGMAVEDGKVTEMDSEGRQHDEQERSAVGNT